MAKYNVHAGHCPDGKGASGAVGLLKESTEARKVKNLVIKKLKQKGHTVYDCTCDVKTTQSGCLVKIVDKCNKHKVSYDISIHLNSGRNDRKGDGKTGGVEAWIYDTANTTTKKKAESIVKAAALPFAVWRLDIKYLLFVLLTSAVRSVILSA